MITFNKRFVYETLVYRYEKQRAYIIDSAIYESDNIIEGLIESVFINKNTEIYTQLIEAPEQYINNFKK